MGTTTPGSDKDIPWVDTISGAMAVGFLGMVIYSWAQRSWLVFACSLLIALASAVAGALAGFLFGIPKTVATATSSTASGTARATSEYQGNSNLEQISDWLTKILVGAGLVQLGAIRTQFDNLSARLQDSKCMGSGGGVAGPAIIIAYLISGFLIAYLWARIYMAKALSGEDQRAAVAHAAGDGSAEATAGDASASQ